MPPAKELLLQRIQDMAAASTGQARGSKVCNERGLEKTVMGCGSECTATFRLPCSWC